jgi:OmpA-OmpF porin, OOP family
MLRYTGIIMIGVLMAANVFAAAAEIPNADVKRAKDSPLVGRFAGSVIVAITQKDFDELSLPALEPVKDKRDRHNNIVYEPKEKKNLKGKRTRLVYLIPAGVSPLEVIRNYQQELSAKGATPLYECKKE